MGVEAPDLVDRISVVREVAERLTDALDPAGLSRAVSEAVRSGLGASALVLAQASEEGRGFSPLLVEGVTGETREWLSRSDRERAWEQVVDAVRDRNPLFWSSLDARDRSTPGITGYRSLARSWAIFPLVVRGDLVGALAIGWPDERRFGPVERTILTVIAHQCALAVDRTRLEHVRRKERAALELLSEGTRLMVSALDPPSVVDALVHLAVPRLAPWCGVYVAEGRTLRRVAIEIAGDRALAAAVRNAPPVSVDDQQPLTVGFRTGRTLVVPIEEGLVRALYASHLAERILRQGDQWTALVVPIQASGRVIGVMSLVSGDWDGSPPDDVRFAAEGLAARAGVALLNARRFEDERATAALLMEAIIPRDLPDVPGYELAARYLPSDGRVAGDWYDVTRLPNGGYLIGIGDVGGHGIAAASLMGQLRNCARGFAVIGRSPAEILDALGAVTADVEDCFATVAYAVLEPEAHALRWSTAGHLPPLWFGDGPATYLEQRGSPPLGCARTSPGEQRIVLDEPGSGVLLVTDGVVEGRRRSLEEGMEHLRKLVEANAAAPAQELVERVGSELCNVPEDDCCIVVLKRR